MSGFLVDTNVVSEVFRPKPDVRVEAWLQAVEPSSVFMSALTGGEIEKGIARLPSGRRRTSLELWFETDLLIFFEGRVLDVDLDVAREWGRLAAWSTARGRSLPVIDGLLAATALYHGLTVVTRNTSDFDHTGVPTLNPWLP